MHLHYVNIKDSFSANELKQKVLLVHKHIAENRSEVVDSVYDFYTHHQIATEEQRILQANLLVDLFLDVLQNIIESLTIVVGLHGAILIAEVILPRFLGGVIMEAIQSGGPQFNPKHIRDAMRERWEAAKASGVFDLPEITPERQRDLEREGHESIARLVVLQNIYNVLIPPDKLYSINAIEHVVTDTIVSVQFMFRDGWRSTDVLSALRNWLVILVVLPFLIHIISLIIGLCILIAERLNSIVVVGYIRLMQQQGPPSSLVV